ncbi:MAG: exodeoxyribonuclease VII small subunit [Alphaproteobacteria bacterium]|nr:exodeoxyribonuclease VII small subunit [Alphaproteobacteria bacterium]OJV15366.1 MAG: exodeoxyribonuclease VII small subunit [Alphaproteobacteria bacterium 33-17]
MTKSYTPDEINNMSFEQALTELEAIVKNLEGGKNSLDYLIQNFEYANMLKKHCSEKLDTAKLKIQKITGLNEAESN